MADQLVPVPLVTPGYKGLNTAQAASTEIDPGYATSLQNVVFDDSGRIASRNGWTNLTTTAVTGTPAIQSMGEYLKADGTTQIVSAAGNKLYAGTTVLTNVTGSLTPSGNSWQWLNFNNLFYGVQSGNTVITWNGTGNFAAITPSSGTVPSGACGVAAFGRLWVLGTDGQTINYCNLLDATAWTGTGAGSINMGTVWTRGTDHVVAIAAAGSKLVVFGEKQIVIFFDNTNPAIGLNPTNISVYDTIEGTGCAARDSVQSTGEGDLTFLSPTGVQSLARLLSSGKDNPVEALDPQIRGYFYGYFSSEDPTKIRSVYSPTNRFYLLLLPGSGRIFLYDTRTPIQDPTFGVILRTAEWPGISWSSLLNTRSGDVLVGQNGVVGQYSGFTDNGQTYQFIWNSPFISMQQQEAENRIKILKRLKAVLNFGGNTNCQFQWGFEFAGFQYSAQLQLVGVTSEYGIAQYNINEYGGGAGVSVQRVPGSGSGRWFQLGMTATINGFLFSLQQIDAFVKLGNLI